MASAVDVAKRLDFQDMSEVLPQALPRETLLQAIAEPSIANFQRCPPCRMSMPPRADQDQAFQRISLQCARALELVDTKHEARAATVRATALEQAAGSGESDLRRLRRQFSSLKNTFCLYDTKENFIDSAPPEAARLPCPC